MKVVQRLVCSGCQNPIQPYDGVIVQGNVYVIGEDIEGRGGIIGNNFPNKSDFSIDDINEVSYCKSCFIKVVDSAMSVEELYQK